MRDTVLVPGDGTAEAGLLDENGVVEGREIGSVDVLGDGQELGVSIQPQSGLYQLAHTEDQVHDLVGCVLARVGFDHLRRMSAADLLRPADRIA